LKGGRLLEGRADPTKKKNRKNSLEKKGVTGAF